MDHDISNNEIPRNEYIDKITMELLMSKPKYNKYLESRDPEKYAKETLYKKDAVRYRTIIQDIINEEFNNISYATNGRTIELTNSFTNFAKECIKYIKIKELELEDPLNHNEDETMFENCDDIEQKIKDSNKSNSNFTISSDDDEDAINSLWGDGAVKYDMKMFARRKR